MLKRITLFILTNIAVVAVIMFILSILDIKPYLQQHHINYLHLLIFAAIVGFAGAFVSLFMSKWIAKTAYSIKILDGSDSNSVSWIYNVVEDLAQKAGIGIPEVGIYESDEPNAFATGWNKNNSLVAVSTGLIRVMKKEEVIGVLGHEISHIANGDMVTMALLQGVVNTFVIFFARIVALIVTQFLSKNDNDSHFSSMTYYLIAIILEILFGILATIIVMTYSRFREYRADAGSANLTSKNNMINALLKLKQYVEQPEDNRSATLNAFKISRSSNKILALFSSHPPIENRIKALEECHDF